MQGIRRQASRAATVTRRDFLGAAAALAASTCLGGRHAAAAPAAGRPLFGISLASAVLIDAFIIRLVFVPSLMSIIGRANWWLPRWLAKILPVVHVEAESDDDPVDDVMPAQPGH